MINLLLFNHFYPVISHRRVRKENDVLLYTVWSLVMVRNRLPAQVADTPCHTKIVQKFRTILIVASSSPTLFKCVLAIHFKSRSLLLISWFSFYLHSIIKTICIVTQSCSNILHWYTKLFKHSENILFKQCPRRCRCLYHHSSTRHTFLTEIFVWFDFDLHSTTTATVRQNSPPDTSRANFHRLDVPLVEIRTEYRWNTRVYLGQRLREPGTDRFSSV